MDNHPPRPPWPSVVAMLLAPVGWIVASIAIPAGVDELPSSTKKTAHILDIVARHRFSTRLGFFAFAVGMLLLIPATTILRDLTTTEPRGRRLVDAGTRLIAVAAGALAIGNSFAPASEPSAIRASLPRGVMVDYMRHHLVNGWDWAIIAFYPLMTVGALLLFIGWWRSKAVSRPTLFLVTVPLFVLIGPPLSPPTVVLGLALEAGFVLVLRQRASIFS
jgi:hypothetical protein